ncbi:HdeD family acid-resistance protein [Erythrobacter rubeus]|uniref:DUF308 domain-containing protein n=1 Tax=Erythrobacter rubeus TaxID=2760803 RepID=A0ABR8KZ89_9SPHN|nr:DUF308 domain-containing protein [Erythrobacter rubeus]MBD2843537.1 DUF308 domain-containing protein [Erythrobacter rubeus]
MLFSTTTPCDLARGDLHVADTPAYVPATNWGWFMLRAALCLALAVAAFVFPTSAVFAFTLVFAAFAAVDGIFSLITGIKGARSKEDRWGMYILRGLLGLGAGIIIAAMPFAATFAYALATIALVAAWAILTGGLEMYAAIRLRREIENEWLLATSGLLSILLGIGVMVLIALNIETTIVAAGFLIGGYALCAAAILGALGFRLREYQRARDRADKDGRNGKEHAASPA